MSDFHANTEVSQGSDRSFGLVFATVFVIVGAYPLMAGGAARIWALGIALAILAVTLIRPSLLKRLNTAWFHFGLLLGRVVSPIVMAVLFFGVVLPLGLLIRLRKGDLLQRRFDSKTSSYWVPVTPEARPSSMRHQF